MTEKAGTLTAKQRLILSAIPYPAWNRSEIFFLAGLRYEAKEQTDKARELFEMSVKEDPSLNWPAMLAKSKPGI